MRVTAKSRIARHPTAGGRGATVRRPAPAAVPALTVTVSVPLIGDGVPPQVQRLIEAVRELVEHGQGTVAVTAPPAAAADPAVAAVVAPAAAPVPAGEPGGVDPAEVRLLAASRRVMIGGVLLPLTRIEFDLLQFLVDNPRRVFSRTQLLSAVWGYEHTGERTVDVHVRRLRVKVGAQVPLITTVYGVGYRLADDAHVVVRPHE